MTKDKIAIVGAGVAGIVSAHLLSRKYDVTLYEKNSYLGGHTNTIEVTEGNSIIPVDTGFIVCNPTNYPNFYKFLDELNVSLRDSDMSFGFHCEETKLTYVGPALHEFVKEPRNFLKAQFLKLILEQRSFNKRAQRDIANAKLAGLTLGEYLDQYKFSEYFTKNYLVALAASIWSSPDKDISNFPAETFIHFFQNHGMLSLKRPRWQTVVGGSYSYIKAFEKRFNGTINLKAKIDTITRDDTGVTLSVNNTLEKFNKVILASHADESLKLLSDATESERALLGSWRYHQNVAILHTDSNVLPQRRSLWASWNYIREKESDPISPISITYYMNKLQGLRTNKDYFVTLNQEGKIDPKKILKRINYSHPVYTLESIASQNKIRATNGNNNTYYCGSYLKYGFHEDAVSSAVEVAKHFGVEL